MSQAPLNTRLIFNEQPNHRLWTRSVAFIRARRILNGLKLAIKYGRLKLQLSFQRSYYTQNGKQSKPVLHANDTFSSGPGILTAYYRC